MTDRSRPSADPLLALYESLQRDVGSDRTVQEALSLGESSLDVDNVHLIHIEAESDDFEAIASTDDADGEFPPELVLDRDTTHCRRVIQDGGSISLHDALEQGLADDPAFRTRGLHCYHGTSLCVDDEMPGTVCFVADPPRSRPFDEIETLFAVLLARPLGHELERRHHAAGTRRRTNTVIVPSRVLRHSLRDDATDRREQRQEVPLD